MYGVTEVGNLLLGRIRSPMDGSINFVAMPNVDINTAIVAIGMGLDTNDTSKLPYPSLAILEYAQRYTYPCEAFERLIQKRGIFTVANADEFANWNYPEFHFRILHVPLMGWYCKEGNRKPWKIPGLEAFKEC